MQTLYKLTDQDYCTRDSTQWGPGVRHKRKQTGKPELCTATVIHAYEDPLVAVFMNPRHANIVEPVLWEARGRVVVREGQLKCGCLALTTVRVLPLPVLTMEQRVEVAIRCALTVCSDPAWREWAERWLSGEDRSRASADAAAAAAWEWSQAEELVDAARAAQAAEAAAQAAEAADAAVAAADAAAWAAARAAAWAVAEESEFDLAAILREVLECK